MNIIIKPCDDGFIVVNLDKVEKYGFDKAHTHIKSKKIARTIKDNILNNRFPKTRNEYLLISHIRVSDDKEYVDKIEHLINTRKNKKKEKYINSQKGTRV
jgi:hypothetical protein